MGKILDQEQLMKILYKQCEWIEVNPNSIDLTKSEWYMNYTWTKRQEEAFIDWSIEFLLKNKLASSKKQAINMAQQIDMMYGWKIRN